MPSKEVKAAHVANKFTEEIKSEIKSCKTNPKLVGFLANNDPAAKMYKMICGGIMYYIYVLAHLCTILMPYSSYTYAILIHTQILVLKTNPILELGTLIGLEKVVPLLESLLSLFKWKEQN